MGINNIGGGRNGFHTFNFNDIMNGQPKRRVPVKADKPSKGVAVFADPSAPVFARSRIYANYGKAFVEQSRQQQEARKASNTGKKDPEYNHKRFARKMKNAKNAQSMQSVLADIRATIADLKAKQATGEYDEEEIAAAILHAELMEAAAMKRIDNLETEEMAERKVKREELEELTEDDGEEQEGIPTVPEEEAAVAQAEQETAEQLDAEMRAMQEEMQRVQEEMMAQMQEELEEMMAEMSEEDPLQALDDMAKVLGASAANEEDLDEMKKKHRAAEDMAVARADMEFLKMKFDRLQRQRDALKSGAAGFGNGASAQHAPQATGFADGAKIVAGAVKSAQMNTALRAANAHVPSGASAGATAGSPAPSAGASIDISG